MLKYRIWDKKSPINGVEAPEVMIALRIKEQDEVYIIQDNDVDWIVQTKDNSPYPGDTIEEKAQAHLDSLLIDYHEKPSYDELESYYATTQSIMPE